METWVYVVLFGIAAVLGLRGSVRLTRRFLAVSAELHASEQLLLGVLLFISWSITLAAGYFGILSLRRLAGFDALPGLVPVSALIATAILYIPVILDIVVERIARVGDG